MKIILVGKDGVRRKLNVNDKRGFRKLLKRSDIVALQDEKGRRITDFMSLENDGHYTAVLESRGKWPIVQIKLLFLFF